MAYKTKQDKLKYHLKWKKLRRDKYIKENGPCWNCGSDKDLEIDHIDPLQKKIRAGDLWSRSKKVVAQELSKCQILCRVCHAKKTYGIDKKRIMKLRYMARRSR